MEERLGCVMDIGEQMLVCGGEVHRVEDSIKRICQAMGMHGINVFIITSSMVVTVCSEDGKSYTQTRRISGIGTDLERLHKLNELSRRICHECALGNCIENGTFSVEEIRKRYHEVLGCKKYPFWMEFPSYAVIAGAFSLFFGGGLREALVALAIGLVLCLTVHVTDKMVTNRIFGKFISSFVTTALAFATMKIGWIENVDKVIIGNIMALIPGIGLTNSLRDLFTGDSIAGLLRFIEAGLMALAIGAGYFAYVCIAGGNIL